MNIAGTLRVRVSAVVKGTLLDEVTRLLDNAVQARSRYVRLADRAARLYAPVVHVTALTTMVGWMALGRRLARRRRDGDRGPHHHLSVRARPRDSRRSGRGVSGALFRAGVLLNAGRRHRAAGRCRYGAARQDRHADLAGARGGQRRRRPAAGAGAGRTPGIAEPPSARRRGGARRGGQGAARRRRRGARPGGARRSSTGSRCRLGRPVVLWRHPQADAIGHRRSGGIGHRVSPTATRSLRLRGAPARALRRGRRDRGAEARAGSRSRSCPATGRPRSSMSPACSASRPAAPTSNRTRRSRGSPSCSSARPQRADGRRRPQRRAGARRRARLRCRR